MSWRVAASLLQLREQVDVHYPNRRRENDGTIGDTAHSARTSDHNPDWQGVVHAMDITHDPLHGFDSYKFADELKAVHDHRIKYLISNRRIWTPSVSPDWRTYSGANPHDHHVHISVVSGMAADDRTPWRCPMLGSSLGTPLPPSPPITDLHEHIVATVFSSEDDGRRGAYGEWLAPGDIYVALPYRFWGERPHVRVHGPRGSAVAAIKDVGPWNINDPYWLVKGKRPQAESGYDLGQTVHGVRTTNRAGIDLSPTLARGIGIDGKGFVNWEFANSAHSDTPAPLPARPAAVGVSGMIAEFIRRVFGGNHA